MQDKNSYNNNQQQPAMGSEFKDYVRAILDEVLNHGENLEDYRSRLREKVMENGIDWMFYERSLDKLVEIVFSCRQKGRLTKPDELDIAALFDKLMIKPILISIEEQERQVKQMVVQKNTFLDFTEYVADTTIDMIALLGGSFNMGISDKQQDLSFGEEMPSFNVTLSDFYISKFLITQEQYRAIMGRNPSYNKENLLTKVAGIRLINNPVEQVSWNDAQMFCQKLIQLTGKHYRLPTEAEWEFAARGGLSSKDYLYSGSNNLEEVGWCIGMNPYSTKPVGGKNSNELGIFDMSGNVREWCNDWYGNYTSLPKTNPTGPINGKFRVCRGGSFCEDKHRCRVTSREGLIPDTRNNYCGFRIVLSQ